MIRWLCRPSPATVMSFVALTVALGGTSYAAFNLPKNSVGTSQLKNGAVTTKKIKSGAVNKSKLNLSGVTAPNATHAITADTATSARNANHAAHASEASVADSPIAWARVKADGKVVAGRGITSANVTLLPASAFCFHGLSFRFQSAAVTVDYGAATNALSTAPFAVGDTGDCNPPVSGVQAEVATTNGTAFAPEPFFIQFFN
jgi:hypothetical protein